MRTLGLIGGTSWESTATYYALLNRGTAERLGPFRQPPLILHSVDFAEVVELQRSGGWDVLEKQYAAATRNLVASGAEVLGICANTMHLVADAVAAAAGDAQLVHVVDATVSGARDVGAGTVALLGTAYTMEKPFYVDGLRARGLEVVVPEADDRAELAQKGEPGGGQALQQAIGILLQQLRERFVKWSGGQRRRAQLRAVERS